jgi:hypothetical protein
MNKGKIILIEEFKQCIHLDIMTYLEIHNVSSLVEASNMADDYPLTNTLMLLKN